MSKEEWEEMLKRWRRISYDPRTASLAAKMHRKRQSETPHENLCRAGPSVGSRDGERRGAADSRGGTVPAASPQITQELSQRLAALQDSISQAGSIMQHVASACNEFEMITQHISATSRKETKLMLVGTAEKLVERISLDISGFRRSACMLHGEAQALVQAIPRDHGLVWKDALCREVDAQMALLRHAAEAADAEEVKVQEMRRMCATWRAACTYTHLDLTSIDDTADKHITGDDLSGQPQTAVSRGDAEHARLLRRSAGWVAAGMHLGLGAEAASKCKNEERRCTADLENAGRGGVPSFAGAARICAGLGTPAVPSDTDVPAAGPSLSVHSEAPFHEPANEPVPALSAIFPQFPAAARPAQHRMAAVVPSESEIRILARLGGPLDYDGLIDHLHQARAVRTAADVPLVFAARHCDTGCAVVEKGEAGPSASLENLRSALAARLAAAAADVKGLVKAANPLPVLAGDTSWPQEPARVEAGDCSGGRTQPSGRKEDAITGGGQRREREAGIAGTGGRRGGGKRPPGGANAHDDLAGRASRRAIVTDDSGGQVTVRATCASSSGACGGGGEGAAGQGVMRRRKGTHVGVTSGDLSGNRTGTLRCADDGPRWSCDPRGPEAPPPALKSGSSHPRAGAARNTSGERGGRDGDATRLGEGTRLELWRGAEIRRKPSATTTRLLLAAGLPAAANGEALGGLDVPPGDANASGARWHVLPGPSGAVEECRAGVLKPALTWHDCGPLAGLVQQRPLDQARPPIQQDPAREQAAGLARRVQQEQEASGEVLDDERGGDGTGTGDRLGRGAGARGSALGSPRVAGVEVRGLSRADDVAEAASYVRAKEAALCGDTGGAKGDGWGLMAGLDEQRLQGPLGATAGRTVETDPEGRLEAPPGEAGGTEEVLVELDGSPDDCSDSVSALASCFERYFGVACLQARLLPSDGPDSVPEAPSPPSMAPSPRRSAVALELSVTDMGRAVVGLEAELLDPATCWWSETRTHRVVVRGRVLLPPSQHSDEASGAEPGHNGSSFESDRSVEPAPPLASPRLLCAHPELVHMPAAAIEEPSYIFPTAAPAFEEEADEVAVAGGGPPLRSAAASSQRQWPRVAATMHVRDGASGVEERLTDVAIRYLTHHLAASRLIAARPSPGSAAEAADRPPPAESAATGFFGDGRGVNGRFWTELAIGRLVGLEGLGVWMRAGRDVGDAAVLDMAAGLIVAEARRALSDMAALDCHGPGRPAGAENRGRGVWEEGAAAFGEVAGRGGGPVDADMVGGLERLVLELLLSELQQDAAAMARDPCRRRAPDSEARNAVETADGGRAAPSTHEYCHGALPEARREETGAAAGHASGGDAGRAADGAAGAEREAGWAMVGEAVRAMVGDLGAALAQREDRVADAVCLMSESMRALTAVTADLAQAASHFTHAAAAAETSRSGHTARGGPNVSLQDGAAAPDSSPGGGGGNARSCVVGHNCGESDGKSDTVEPEAKRPDSRFASAGGVAAGAPHAGPASADVGEDAARARGVDAAAAALRPAGADGSGQEAVAVCMGQAAGESADGGGGGGRIEADVEAEAEAWSSPAATSTAAGGDSDGIVEWDQSAAQTPPDEPGPAWTPVRPASRGSDGGGDGEWGGVGLGREVAGQADTGGAGMLGWDWIGEGRDSMDSAVGRPRPPQDGRASPLARAGWECGRGGSGAAAVAAAMAAAAVAEGWLRATATVHDAGVQTCDGGVRAAVESTGGLRGHGAAQADVDVGEGDDGGDVAGLGAERGWEWVRGKGTEEGRGGRGSWSVSDGEVRWERGDSESESQSESQGEMRWGTLGPEADECDDGDDGEEDDKYGWMEEENEEGD